MHARAALLSFALMVDAGAAAQATTTVYTDQTAFLAAISGAATDDFDDLTIAPLGNAITRSAGDYSYQLSADQGLWGAGENGDGWISTNNGADEIVFTNFTGGVSAIGGFFFGSTASGGYGGAYQISVTMYDASGARTWELPMYPTQTSFLGFTSSNGLQSLRVQMTGFPVDGLTPEQITAYDDLWPTANGLILGQSAQDSPPPPSAVPEPASWALMLAGFGLVGTILRRRRRSRVSFG